MRVINNDESKIRLLKTICGFFESVDRFFIPEEYIAIFEKRGYKIIDG